MERGAEFGKVQPLDSRGLIITTANLSIPIADFGLENGLIHQLSDFDAFRIGQQMFFWVGILNPVISGNWWSQVQLKPFWLRPNTEYRAPGTPSRQPNLEVPPNSGWTPNDDATFHPGPVVGQPTANNRYIWIPEVKRFDITEYFPGPTPPPSPARSSASEFEDNFWQWNLQPSNTLGLAALFPAPQVISRWSAFLWPAMGYALAFTANGTAASGQSPSPPTIDVSVSWAVGTLGATNYQESVG